MALKVANQERTFSFTEDELTLLLVFLNIPLGTLPKDDSLYSSLKDLYDTLNVF